ncbi:MAG: glutamate synthase subunit alpha [Chloroflexi bacterium]|nr:glutamate synthase subunit alpha [Chloroflexota bacterium]
MIVERLRPIEAPLYDPRDEHDACGVGFVADLDGRHVAHTVPMALEALAALAHRGARGADDLTGDGAGISIPISSRFRSRLLAEAGVATHARRRVAIGMCFLPPSAVDDGMRLIEDRVAWAGLAVAGWRSVPVRSELVALRAIHTTPAVWQAMVVGGQAVSATSFVRRLAMARRSVQACARVRPELEDLSMPSLSADTVAYKGLFVGNELGRFYEDLQAPDLDARYAVFHQRYSTNTFPSWRLAQPFGYLAHNGEINTIRSNREAMRGRRRSLGRARWARQLAEAAPLVSEHGSDSESLDDAVELLILSGMPIDQALGELVPPAPGLGGTDRPGLAKCEPWDGPAALVFADGRRVGATLDRNGLRPLALVTTRDGLVIASSEAGSVELSADRVVARHRLGPGEMVVADTLTGRFVGPTTERPRSSSVTGVPFVVPQAAPSRTSEPRERVAIGLDAEIIRQVVRPMAIESREATWSMGDDIAIAPLAARPRRVSAFLRQAFAQVTNPAIDPDRERAVMSLRMAVGRQLALLDEAGPPAVLIEGPVLDAAGWHSLLSQIGAPRVAILDATWPARRGPSGVAFALGRLGRQVRSAVRRGAHLIVLSDRAVSPTRAALPPQLAVGRVNQELVGGGVRSRCDVAIECGECFDVHDVAMLLAAGASAIHPWLLLELASEQAGSRGAEELAADDARTNVVTALEAGIRKVLARMGISTLASYRGGQNFDVLGLDPALVRRCFPAARSWPGAIGVEEIGAAIMQRHRRAHGSPVPALEDPGLVRFRGSGEPHAYAPRVVKALQALTGPSAASEATVPAYVQAVDAGGPRQPRNLLTFRRSDGTVPLTSVEPAELIVRRFVSSAMSLGALSPEAHQAISAGMARLGGSANSGEGGEDPAWYARSDSGDRRDAAIKQVASGRFGVTTEYLVQADQLEIKIAQGSKPGEGGQLPGMKVTPFIAALRRGQPGMTMISPPPHHDIYSIEDLAQLIADLRAVNPRARIGVKLVAGAGIGTIAAGVAKAHADYIMVSGHAGGTGASPLSSIKHAGLPWELGLAETHQVLVRNRLRDRVTLRTDGGLQTGRDVIVAAMLGAEEFGFGTAALVALGCDMARQCHLDTCPTGIATQREDLRAKFTGRPEDVVAFFAAIAEDVRRELAGLGLHGLGDAVGRVDLLVGAPESRLDLDRVLSAPAWRSREPRTPPRDRALYADRPTDTSLEAAALPVLLRSLEAGEHATLRGSITTRDRSIGARMGGALSRRAEPRQLARVSYELAGAAGQSLGAFAVTGMRITVTGEANDYVAKGLSGGTVVIRPPEAATLGQAQVIAGNVCLFGATAGALHVVGRAGMRFAVRNSGARAVVEGIGAHGCEYMTGGTVLVLGEVGPNFGAGMTGGRAFVLDSPALAGCLNGESVVARPVAGPDEQALRDLLGAHAAEGSRLAIALMAAWNPALFVVVEPRSVAEISLTAASGERALAAR